MAHISIRTTLAALFVIGSAIPAFAQDAMCGLDNNGYWIGDDEAGSDIATATDNLDKLSLVAANSVYVSLFTLSEQANVRMEAVAQGGGDTVVQLYDEVGRIILEDDDSGGDGSARAETLLDAGTYCLATRSFDGNTMMAHVRIGLSDFEPLTSGTSGGGGGGAAVCTSDTDALDLASGALDALLAEGVSATNSVDNTPFYRFTLDAPSALSLTAENVSADPVLELYSSTGELLAENDDTNGYNSRIDMSLPLAAGEYCVAVRALSDTSLPITVSVFAYDEASILTALYDAGNASPPLDGTHPVQDMGLVGARERVDQGLSDKAVWYSFDVEESGLILIEAIGVGESDPVLTLYDDLGRQVAYNDDTSAGRDAQISTRILPGTYVFAVTQAGGGSGAVRLLLERYVAVR